MNQVAELNRRLERLPRVGLANLPTPFEPLDRLSQHLGGPKIWVKREDCTGLGFGGNKLRKLDYVLARALTEGADSIVSGGVVQSNSQRQVAAAAAKLGLECHLAIFHGRVAPPGEAYAKSGNAFLNRLFGAQLHEVPWTGDRNAALHAQADELRAAGKKPFNVPYGVSNDLGAAGYASAAAEIAVQSKAEGFVPAAIVHCSGSGATQAGLAVGASLVLPDTEVLGIDIDAEPERVRADVTAYARGAASLLGVAFADERIKVLAGMAGPAYGVPHRAAVDALWLAGRLEALTLDPTYSAKGLAGLIALIRQSYWRDDQHVVFVHTGGEPAIFAHLDSLATGDQAA